MDLKELQRQNSDLAVDMDKTIGKVGALSLLFSGGESLKGFGEDMGQRECWGIAGILQNIKGELDDIRKRLDPDGKKGG